MSKENNSQIYYDLLKKNDHKTVMTYVKEFAENSKLSENETLEMLMGKGIVVQISDKEGKPSFKLSDGAIAFFEAAVFTANTSKNNVPNKNQW
jgi:heat shock protein HspQ